MTGRNRRAEPGLELRRMLDGRMVIGPVQAALLQAIRATGSIAAARRQIGAGYAHVWKLAAAMSETFAPPSVEPMRGGVRGGGAMLTAQGHKVLESFRRLEGPSKARGHTELLVIGRAASHAIAKQA